MKQSQLNISACHDCVFAGFDDNIQTKCYANRLDMFSNKAEKVFNGKTFYVVSPKCIFYRNKGWKNFNENKDILSLIDVARDELSLPVDVFIQCENSLDGIENTLNSISNQILRPKKVIIYVNFEIGESQALDLIEKCKSVGLMYEIKFMTDKHNNLREYIMQNHKSPFLFFITCGITIDNNTIEQINKSIIDDGNSFIFVWSKSDDLLFMLREAYTQLFPETLKDIIEKYKNSQPCFNG